MLISHKSFELISEVKAATKFQKWCEQMENRVNRAMNKALNVDGRLCLQTKEKIFNEFISEIKNPSEDE